jgi:hypothetical protein
VSIVSRRQPELELTHDSPGERAQRFTLAGAQITRQAIGDAHRAERMSVVGDHLAPA